MRVCVVIPAYNEVGRAGDTVRAIFALGAGYDVMVVDDGSSDGTSDATRFAGATMFRHSVNRGQGAALQTGTEWALAHDADYIVHFDADGQFNAADIPRAVQYLQEHGVDILLGSRMLAADNVIPATKRYVLLPIARLVNWAFTGVWLTDAHNGFRVLSRRAAEQIVIHHDRMAHNTDIIAQIREHGLSFAEMPVRVRYDRYGQGLSGGVKIVADLLVGWFL